jgi:TolB-like protein/DNA-binding winged helix-turn-helix (wHTH) protein/Flp pilus assembly protein TadD
MAFDLRVAGPIRFAQDFELDLRSYELRHSGRVLKLERIPMELLVLLIEERGQLVSRDRIVERIWGRDVFLDTDNSINAAIRKIRQVLKDDPEKPHFVQTITGRGYRFIAQVQEPGVNPSPEPVMPQKSAHMQAPVLPPPTRTRRPYLWIVVLALGASVFFIIQRFTHPVTSVASIHSIAVLPLDNLSGDPAQDYFADAMTDELITNLARLGSLRVTSRTTVTLYKHTRKSLPEIARELNVDGIVEGSVVRSGQRVRITAQLIRGSSDQHLWAETYERDFGDALKLQSDVAGAIAEQVRAKLTFEQQAQFRSARPVNPDAYDAYLKGSYYLYNSPITQPGPLDQAKAYFEEAIRRDPNFSRAYSGLASAYIYLSVFGQAQISSAESYKYAKEANSRALQLDPNNGEAYEVLGVLNWRADFDWDAADRAFNRSLALSPSYSCAHEDRAMFLASMGRRTEALAEVDKSKQVDPSATWLESVVYFQLRDWPRVVESGVREAASNPTDWPAHARLGAGFEGTGKLPEAIAEYQKASDLSNGNFDAIASLGHAYAAIGNKAQAEAILRRLEQKAKDGRASPYFAATIYAGLGNKDKAFQLIEQAYRERSFDIAWVLKPDLRTDNLRSDPRFQNLLHRTGLSQ